MFKKILYLLLISFIVIQFFQINKTPNNALSGDIKTKYSVSESLDKTLKVACNVAIATKPNILGMHQFNPSVGGFKRI